MRASAILGPGSSPRDLKPFQRDRHIDWSLGLPKDPSEAEVVLLFGGDGTVHQHLGPLVRLERPVLVVPRGSGNDFARALRLGKLRDSLDAWQAWIQGARNVRSIDLGIITPLRTEQLGADPPSWFPANQAQYFCSVAGCGLDQQTARLANQLPSWLRARGGYALALVAALVRFRPMLMNLQAADESSPNERLTKQRTAMLVALANTPFYGGGMLIAPRARLDDGKLDVCLVERLGKFRLLSLFPSVYFGSHLKIREVEYFQADRLRLETETPVEVWADGEYVCRTPVAISLSRAAFQVIVGDGFPSKARGESASFLLN